MKIQSKFQDQVNINIRVSRKTRTDIAAKADAANLTMTDYIVRTAMQRQINNSNTSGIVIALRDLADQQRELVRHDRRNEHQYQRIMDAIVTALLSIPKRMPTNPSKTSPWLPDHGLSAAPCQSTK